MNWHNTAEAARYANRHSVTVRRAAVGGDLHGHQSSTRGHWTFAESALDAWVMGLPERAQRDACGCLRMRTVRVA